jgi:signal transduction histidine kinase
VGDIFVKFGLSDILEKYVTETTELSWTAHCLLLLACFLPLFTSFTDKVAIVHPPEFGEKIAFAVYTAGWAVPLLGILVFLVLSRTRLLAGTFTTLEHTILLGVISVCVLALIIRDGELLLALVPVFLIALDYGKKAGIAAAVLLCLLMAVQVQLSSSLEYSEMFFASVIILMTLAYLIGGMSEMNKNLIRELDRERVALKNLVDGLPLGICVINSKGEINYRNPLIGETEARLCATLMNPQREECHNLPQVGTGFTGVNVEFEDQHYRIGQSTCSLGSGEETILMVENVSETRRLEEEIRRASYLASIGEMAAGVAHEIRNPLAVIRGYVQLIAEKNGERRLEEVKPRLRTVLDEIDHLSVVIQEFLDLAKPREITRVPLNLNRVVDNIHQFLENEARRQEINLTVKLDPALPEITGDPAGLKQVIFNLVSNAFQAAGPGGKVRLWTRHADKWVYLVVGDNGPGVPEHLREKIFAPFFSTKNTGTGIGLAISRRIILDHGGTITCRSKSGNTQFLVQLPLSFGKLNPAHGRNAALTLNDNDNPLFGNVNPAIMGSKAGFPD